VFATAASGTLGIFQLASVSNETTLEDQMSTQAKAPEDLRLWLLGLLPDHESRVLEERLITDADFYEELLIVEDELIDEYIAGRLTTDERTAFESYFMNSPERQEQFRIANALRSYIGDAKDPTASEAVTPIETHDRKTPWLFSGKPIVTISLAATVLLICALAWLAWGLRPSAPVRSMSVVLTPATHTREGGSIQQVTISPGTDSIQFQLTLTRSDFQKYRVTLVNSDGATIQKIEDLAPLPAGGRTLQFSVRAQQLPPGEYQLKVDGVAPDGRFQSADSYRFAVTRN
jgi:hypothetical protein